MVQPQKILRKIFSIFSPILKTELCQEQDIFSTFKNTKYAGLGWVCLFVSFISLEQCTLLSRISKITCSRTCIFKTKYSWGVLYCIYSPVTFLALYPLWFYFPLWNQIWMYFYVQVIPL